MFSPPAPTALQPKIARQAKPCPYCNQLVQVGEEAVFTKRGMAHPVCKERRAQLFTTAVAAEQLGLTPEQFRKLADKTNLKPEGEYDNPYYKSGPSCPLWSPEAVTALLESPELDALKARSVANQEARQRKQTQRAIDLATRYPDWHAALFPAAETLFNLNRYAKHDSCSKAHRQEIYDLKTPFVHLLYRLGLAVDARRHLVQRAGKECWGCEGLGCEKCDYTGCYRESGTLAYIAFRFQIERRYFAWHQPEQLVNWLVTLTEGTASDWTPEGEKPVMLNKRAFADAKALLRYVLNRAKQVSPVDTLSEKESDHGL